jgi:F-type H+-transporting ATPase subunit delta
MRGISRASLAGLRERLAATANGPAQADILGDEMFALVRLIDGEHGLRRALADPAKPGAEKSAIIRQILQGKVSSQTVDLAAEATAQRWASPSDFSDALEELAVEAYVMVAEYNGTLDDLEDDLFRFARVIAATPDLRAALTGSAPEAAKQELANSLLARKVSGPALSLITQVVTHSRGRSPQAALNVAAQVAAKRREQLLATVRVAAPLDDRQRQRLQAALSASYGHQVHLNVVLDPAVVGGMSVQIGDELIDGTAASRLAEVRRRLAS